MFDIPKKTLLESLNTLLERPKEYLADVCFVFESKEIWAHRGKRNMSKKKEQKYTK